MLRFITAVLISFIPSLVFAQGGGGMTTTSPPSVSLRNLTNFSVGPYSAFVNAQNAGGLIQDKDYQQTVTVHPQTFPNVTIAQWNWNLGTTTIRSFLQMAGYGNYFDTVPNAPITPSPVNSIAALTAQATWTTSGTTNGYDIIYDYFLCHTTTNVNASDHAFEIEIALHMPAFFLTYFNSITPIGTVTISGISWDVAIDTFAGGGLSPDILFKPTSGADVPNNSIDLNAMHLYLISKGVITGGEYYTGHTLGMEVAQGSGNTFLSSASVIYTPGAASFNITYEDNAVDATSQTTYTYASKAFNIGPADPTRIVTACEVARAGTTTPTINSMTIGGVAATKVDEARNTAGSALTTVSLWQAAVPTGTTATVTAVFSAAMVRSGVALSSILGSNGTAPTGGTTTNATAAGNVVSGTITVPTGGGSVICNGVLGNGLTPTNYTSDFVANIGSTLDFGVGHDITSGSRSYTSTWATGATVSTSVFSAWGP